MISQAVAKEASEHFHNIDEVRKGFDSTSSLYIDREGQLFCFVQLGNFHRQDGELLYVGTWWLTKSRAPKFPVRLARAGTRITIENE